jgi:hypothetical protein
VSAPASRRRRDRPAPAARQLSDHGRQIHAYLEEHREEIRAVVDTWPPLTEEQKRALVLLLRPGGDSDG